MENKNLDRLLQESLSIVELEERYEMASAGAGDRCVVYIE